MTQTTVQADTRAEAPDHAQPSLWWAVLQLTSLSIFIPLSWLSGSQRALANPMSALLVGGVVAFVSFAAYLLTIRLTSRPWRALAWVSVGVFFFWQWGAWGSQNGWVGSIGSLTIMLLVMLAIGKVAEHRFFQRTAFVVSITLSLTMLMLIVVDSATAEPSSIIAAATPDLGSPVRTPDVLFIVLDAYARQDVLQEVYEFDNRPFIEDLEISGFRVANSANANYTATHFSISSILSMSYLGEPDEVVDDSDLRFLSTVVSGANPVVETLKADGYNYIHGSADNWLNRCSDAADLCFPGPVVDQTAFNLLAKTPAGPLLYPKSGNPTTKLNLVRLDQLRNWRSIAQSAGDGPVFAYLHLGLPHPPLFLEADCQPRLHRNLDGQLITGPTTSPEVLEVRKAAYVEQVMCANSTILAFLDELDGDEIVVIASDHGPDSFGAFDVDPRVWTDEQLHERLATLTAIRLPEGCANPTDDNLQLVNIFRIAFSCIYRASEIPFLAPEYWATSFSGPIVPIRDPDRITP